ncbi:MAG: DNA polymerase III subunit beta [Planctomycetes bacterium]|nr:DNA polymerase III subunit beta [Planctomycetota bacterium]
MKLSVSRAELAEALSVVGSVPATRSPKPVLHCTLFDVHGDYAMLVATDLELGVRFSITQIEVEKEGSVLVAADKFGQIVRESTDETLAIEVEENICHIRGADSHFQIYGQDAKQFPQVTQFEGACDFQVPAVVLRRMSEWTVFATARENTRYAINGVLWEQAGRRLTLVATDGRRLSKAVHQLDDGVEGDRRAIVPIKAMNLFLRVLPNDDSVAEIKITPNQFILKTARATVSTALVEGHFPNYEDVIPSECNRKAEFTTQELLSAVRRAALLTNEESKGIRLAFDTGVLSLSSRAPEQGEAVVTIPVQYEGTAVEIGFNPLFLSDVLRVVSSETVTFEFAESNRPGVFRCGDDFLYVVMPVNLS